VGEGKGQDAEEWPEPGHITQELLPVPAFNPRFCCPSLCTGGSRV
jgi:hypothetical protein